MRFRVRVRVRVRFRVRVRDPLMALLRHQKSLRTDESINAHTYS